MICKNCSAEYDDNLEVCPECGAEKENNLAELNQEEGLQDETQKDIAETVQEASEELSEQEGAQEPEETQEAEEEAEEVSKKTETEEAETEESGKTETAEEGSQDSEQSEPETAADEGEQKEKEIKKAPAVRKTTGKNRRIKRQPVTKKEKRVSACIIVLMCLVGALAVGLSALSITTDIFESDDSGEKMVASVGFTPHEEKELEKILANCFSAAKKEYSCGLTDAETFLERINPADKGNVYSRLNNVTEALQTEADPAERFADENGEYAYYKLEEGKVDTVLELFGLESYHCENTEKYYYCDGYYYFAAEESQSTPSVAAEITKSRRVLDGSYYAEGYFYAENGTQTVKTDTCHFVIEMNKDEQTGESSFTIRKISAKPIFGSDGKVLDSVKSCEKKTEVIEGRTDDGKLFCKYIVEYPVLEGDGLGYKNVNDFFKNAISVYKLKADAAQESYKAFKEKGGDDSQLPFAETAVAEIVFEDEKNISFIGNLSTLNPEPQVKVQEQTDYYGQQEEEVPTVKLYERTVEAYTIDKSSGNFVSKDSVLGKDYMLLSEILYRIYGGYEYDDLLPEEEQESATGEWEAEDYDYYGYDEIPEDTEELGNKIYESAWALTEGGVTFYYVTEKGYVKEVTIPYSVVEIITAEN